ncbi:MAG: hypothetical protein GY737_00555 [Desulfobacteraceae bacterium]|nr:hypothetical protein [Desulfobacteraceae bacterium]
MVNDNEKVFLTEQEAKAAVEIDFRQYGPQPRLYRELSPLILGGSAIVLDQGRHTGVWIKQGRKNTLQPINAHALGDHLCQALQTRAYPLPVLAEICTLTFQVRACPGPDPGDTTRGIWIESDMDDFHCSQCGDCCRGLAYHNDCTEQDYRRWQRLGLTHILERVQVLGANGETKGYRIWVEPGSNRLSPVCPWLREPPGENRCTCLIQDVKPGICTQYPFTRKHAIMTGCRGKFKKQT